MNSLRKLNWRRVLDVLMLAAYGSTGVLGYGLHSLWHHHHHSFAGCSHHGGAIACCGNTASHDGHDQHHSENGTRQCHGSQNSVPLGEQLIAAADECSICAFLAQAQPGGAATASSLRSDTCCTKFPAYELPVLPELVQLHLARGPPLV